MMQQKSFITARTQLQINTRDGFPPQSKMLRYFINGRVSPAIDINGYWFQFVITLKLSGELIGDIGLHFFDKENKQVEIGFTLNKDYQKKGMRVKPWMKSLNSYLRPLKT
ncbi:MAG: GNAT family N-acetyltransferase [Marinilabiliales bacterium]|nr:GNAT family N-acetyltransferase [Marinilabiliales bacterium]